MHWVFYVKSEYIFLTVLMLVEIALRKRGKSNCLYSKGTVRGFLCRHKSEYMWGNVGHVGGKDIKHGRHMCQDERDLGAELYSCML